MKDIKKIRGKLKKLIGYLNPLQLILFVLFGMILFQISIFLLEPQSAIRIYEVETISGEVLVLDSYEYCAVLIRKGEVAYFDDYFIIDCWSFEVDYRRAEIPDYNVMVASFKEEAK